MQLLTSLCSTIRCLLRITGATPVPEFSSLTAHWIKSVQSLLMYQTTRCSRWHLSVALSEKRFSALIQHIESVAYGLGQLHRVESHFWGLTDRFSRLISISQCILNHISYIRGWNSGERQRSTLTLTWFPDLVSLNVEVEWYMTVL